MHKRLMKFLTEEKILYLKQFGSTNNFSIDHVTMNLIHYKAQPAITCSKLTIETLEQGVKYVQS